MLELTNEIPSDSELRDYFLAEFAFTVTGELPPPLGAVASAELSLAWADFARLGGKCFLQSLGESIYASLQRLNQLPRTDLFWHQTNRRPTVYKLHEFCALVLKRNPADSLALRTTLALSVLQGSAFWGLAQWRQLRAAGALTAEEVVCQAIYSELVLGEGEPSATAELFAELDLVAAAKPLLEECRKSEAKLLHDWGESLLTELAGTA